MVVKVVFRHDLVAAVKGGVAMEIWVVVLFCFLFLFLFFFFVFLIFSLALK